MVINRLILLIFICTLFGCSRTRDSDAPDTATGTATVQQGDPAHHGGTPTIRKSYEIQADNPTTTNNESNDQPLGHFGKRTINAHYVSSGNSYPLDADIDDGKVTRLYFQKGGWVDMDSGEIDENGHGAGTDEQGKEWEFEGFANGDVDQASTSAEPAEDREEDSE